MVRISVLHDALKTMYNAEKRGKRQVLIRPSSKVVIKFLQVMMKHGEQLGVDYTTLLWRKHPQYCGGLGIGLRVVAAKQSRNTQTSFMNICFSTI